MDAIQIITIIMPCYNAEATLAETLHSIADQTYPYWQLIAINDGSQDNTLSILEVFKTCFPDKVRIINQLNLGQVQSKNKGLKYASSPWIAFIDADDLWHRDKLIMQLAYMNQNLNIGLSYTNGEYIDEKSKTTGVIGINVKLQGQCLDEFLMGNAIVASSVMIRRTVLDKIGYFDEKLSACENWELWTRIASISNIGIIDKILVYYRRHLYNMSHNIEKMKQNRFLVIQKNAIQYSGIFLDINQKTKLALFRAYAFFGENALWHLNLKDARLNLWKAIQYQPYDLKCWVLLVKSFLGYFVLNLIRKYKALYE